MSDPRNGVPETDGQTALPITSRSSTARTSSGIVQTERVGVPRSWPPPADPLQRPGQAAPSATAAPAARSPAFASANAAPPQSVSNQHGALAQPAAVPPAKPAFDPFAPASARNRIAQGPDPWPPAQPSQVSGPTHSQPSSGLYSALAAPLPPTAAPRQAAASDAFTVPRRPHASGGFYADPQQRPGDQQSAPGQTRRAAYISGGFASGDARTSPGDSRTSPGADLGEDEGPSVSAALASLPIRRPRPDSQPGLARPDSQPGVVRPDSQPGVARPDSQPGVVRPDSQPGAARPDTHPGAARPDTHPGSRPTAARLDSRPGDPRSAPMALPSIPAGAHPVDIYAEDMRAALEVLFGSQALPSEQLQHLAARAWRCEVPRGKHLVRAGEPAAIAWLVVSGFARLELDTAAGSVALAPVRAGEWASSEVLAGAGAYAISVVAASDLHAMALERGELAKLRAENPALAARLLAAALGQGARRANGQIGRLCSYAELCLGPSQQPAAPEPAPSRLGRLLARFGSGKEEP